MSATIESRKTITLDDSVEPELNRPSRRRWLMISIAAVGAALWGGHLIYHAFLYQETDDAYLNGHVHQISPQVEGTVKEVLVTDNQTVKAGDILVRLDPLQYEIAVQKANASLVELKAEQAHAVAAMGQTAAEWAEAQARTAQAGAQVRQAEAQLELAQKNDQRNQQVFQNNKGAISRTDLDATHSVLTIRQADVDAAQANLSAAKTGETSAKCAQDSAQAEEKAAEAAVAAAEAQVREAQRQLGLTTLVAPADGRIGNKNVESGNHVQTGETLFALVEPDIWVVANFKETQLSRMQPGQEVDITIDALPGKVFRGRIDSLAPASGAEFALLPADNATGNFTKVVQRIPVKITFDSATRRELSDHLRPGLSVIVNVRVR